MNHRFVPSAHFFCFVILSFFVAPTLWAQVDKKSLPNDSWQAADNWFIYVVALFVLIGSLVSILWVRKALAESGWSFADALSESVAVTATGTDSNNKKVLKLNSAGDPITIQEMRASSSRVIALVGSIVILLMFIGFGVLALFSYAHLGQLPESIENVISFLVAGLTLFAPYVVNKFSKLFETSAR